MKGVQFEFNDVDKLLSVLIDPTLIEIESATIEAAKKLFLRSQFSQLLLDEDALQSALNMAIRRRKESKDQVVAEAIARQKDAKLEIDVESDCMQVNATVTGAYGGSHVTASDILARLELLGIKRGISRKRVTNLAQRAQNLSSGHTISEVIAKGLPPRKGKDSRVKALVASACERILAPQSKGNDKVDMRNLGQIISVEAGNAVAKILPPHPGRTGFDVYGRALPAVHGQDMHIVLGPNTELDTKNPKIIVATVAGQPKFINGTMHIDDVYEVKGVNVKTGNIDYNGAVVVNGDVTENMIIRAVGDVTINGFVESAYIETNGDIVITEGIIGKPDDESGVLKAGGKIYVAHAQHVNITCGSDLWVAKQLAHSKVRCRGDLFVGSSQTTIDGSVFACKLSVGGKVEAGNIGAVSGSKLVIDYTDSISELRSKSEILAKIRVSAQSNYATHKLNLVKIKKLAKGLSISKISQLEQLIHQHNGMTIAIASVEEAVKATLDQIYQTASVVAHQMMYAGVVIKLPDQRFEVKTNTPMSVVRLNRGALSVVPIKA